MLKARHLYRSMHCALQTMLLAFAIVLGSTAAAAAASADLCLDAIADAERRDGALPEGLMQSIALIESGHRPSGGRWVPWPWTINSPAGSFYLGSRREAVAKVEALQRQGITNIDVGCMQINLHHHPKAFRTLDDAFRPDSNIAYAAGFLRDLMASNRNLFHAVGRYHSSTPQRRDSYARKVFARWDKDVGIGAAAKARSKHGVGNADSKRIVVRAEPAPAKRSSSNVWQGVYGDRSNETQLVDSAGGGSWLRRSETLAPTMPRNAGQITYR